MTDEAHNPETIDVTTADMIAAMEATGRRGDDEVFRYFQITLFGTDGMPVAGPTLRLTLGQLRKDIGA